MARNIVVSQTPICLKLDSGQLARLDKLCADLGVKRNKLLNFFIERGISALENPKNLLLTHIYSTIEF